MTKESLIEKLEVSKWRDSYCSECPGPNAIIDDCIALIREHQAAQGDVVENLKLTLERMTANFRLMIAGKPVRDVTETLAESDAAIAAMNMGEPSVDATRALKGAETPGVEGAQTPSPAKTSWTCPDCCVNPCNCKFMGSVCQQRQSDNAEENQPREISVVDSTEVLEAIRRVLFIPTTTRPVADAVHEEWRQSRAILNEIRPYLRTSEPVAAGEISDVMMNMKSMIAAEEACENAYGETSHQLMKALHAGIVAYLRATVPAVVSLDKCGQAVALSPHHGMPIEDCFEVAKAVLESLKAQGVEVVYDN